MLAAQKRQVSPSPYWPWQRASIFVLGRRKALSLERADALRLAKPVLGLEGCEVGPDAQLPRGIAECVPAPGQETSREASV